MDRHVVIVIYVLLMIAVIVGMDVAFFRHLFWKRLAFNVGTVAVFAFFYLLFFRRQ